VLNRKKCAYPATNGTGKGATSPYGERAEKGKRWFMFSMVKRYRLSTVGKDYFAVVFAAGADKKDAENITSFWWIRILRVDRDRWRREDRVASPSERTFVLSLMNAGTCGNVLGEEGKLSI